LTVVDFDALESAGIANARGRSGLIDYLDGLGFSPEEMIEAERAGRLFGLAGDAVQRSGRPVYSLRTAAQTVGVPLEEVQNAWAVLGLTVAGPDHLALSQADVDGLATWAAYRTLVGDDGALGLLRVIGAAVERLAEAESAVVRAGFPDIQLNHTHDELITARAYRAISEYVPRTAAMIDAVHRQHLIAARSHFEAVLRDTSDNAVCGVGFADLCGFTALTQLLTPTELSALLNEFNATATDVVHADGGRVVKFIGDAVMWVSSTPELLAKAALDLVDHQKARQVHLRVRAGLAYGDVIAIGGDYFGNPVNLAARLVAAAGPGQVLAASSVREELPHWAAIVQDPLTLKGFAAPVTAYELRGPAGRDC
jgi:class 3 adenylate cyclase